MLWWLLNYPTERLIRGIGRIESRRTTAIGVSARKGTPVKIADVADVQIGAELKRGDGSFMVKKQLLSDNPKLILPLSPAPLKRQWKR